MRKKPNIIFILTDDQGAWAMNCAGNADIKTPNLNYLAESGIRFDNFFCASPVCSPARSSLMLGSYPSKTSMKTNLYQSGCRIQPKLYRKMTLRIRCG